jgi:hypothetical protein
MWQGWITFFAGLWLTADSLFANKRKFNINRCSNHYLRLYCKKELGRNYACHAWSVGLLQRLNKLSQSSYKLFFNRNIDSFNFAFLRHNKSQVSIYQKSRLVFLPVRFFNRSNKQFKEMEKFFHSTYQTA